MSPTNHHSDSGEPPKIFVNKLSNLMSELRIEPALGTLPQGTGHQATVSAGAISNLTIRAANDPSVFTIMDKAYPRTFSWVSRCNYH